MSFHPNNNTLRQGDVTCEDHLTEFKEFVINTNALSESEFYRIIVNTGIVKEKGSFNQLILDTLQTMILMWLPKYTSIFSNYETKESHAKMLFGIRDIGCDSSGLGIVTGIPFFGSPECLHSVVAKTIAQSNCFVQSDRVNSISYSIIKLDVDNDHADYCAAEEYLEEKKQEYVSHKKKYLDFIQCRRQWRREINQVHVGVSNYLMNDDLAQHLMVYISTHCVDTDQKRQLLDKIISKEVSWINNVEEIAKVKDDANDLVFWIILCRDTLIEKILRTKPKEVFFTGKINNFYGKEFSLMYNLRHRLLRNNKDLSYYVVHFDIPTNSKKTVYYLDQMKQTWIAKRRILTPLSEPSCETISIRAIE